MGKGFGRPRQGDLGYVLLLIREAKAYAASFSLGREGEEFIGITSSLEAAQIWKTKQEARQAVGKYYLGLLMEQLESTSQVEISIRKLKRLNNGKLKDEPDEDLIFEQTSR